MSDLAGSLKSLVFALALLCAVPFPSTGAAQEELAKKNACFSCHSVEKKLVGPAYKDIAAKYRSDKSAEGKLVDKVKKGGAGVWGQVPMPPNPNVSDADARALVKWILTLK